MGKIDLRTRSAVDLIPNRCSSNRHPPIMYNSGNVQICNYWKQRIFKEERGVIANLEQQKTQSSHRSDHTHRSQRSRDSRERPQTSKSRPATAYSQSRPATAYSRMSERSDCSYASRRTQDDALLRSTIERMNHLEDQLAHEKQAREHTESQLRDLQSKIGR